MWAILSLLVENRPGVLFKVTHLFRSRNFNIDSISVGRTSDPDLSRMTVTTRGDERHVQQVVKQLDKMIDTVRVTLLDEHKAVYRELALFRVRVSSPAESVEINRLAGAYGGKVHDARRGSVMVELTATPDQIDALEDLVRGFGILETARTGIAALGRGGAGAP